MRLTSFLLNLVMLLATACGGSITSSLDSLQGEAVALKYSRLLKIEKIDSFHIVRIINPWDSTAILHSYLLIPDSVSYPENLPGDATVVRTPLNRAVVYSTIHQSLLDELDAAGIITGVTDVEFISDSTMISRIKNGKVADCGHHSAPTVERIISLNPDGILLSPYENGGSYGKLTALGIPLIECADYMEESPLGRAEWLKFFGLLTGRYEEACSIFSAEESRYDSLKALVQNTEHRPDVLMDCTYNGVWYVPRHDSTTACYIRDAGGNNPFDYLSGAGSAGLNPEKVVMAAGRAPLWLVRYSQSTPLTMKQLVSENNLYQALSATKDGEVWGANSAREDYFSIIPFHPSIFLEDMIKVIHPEVADTLSAPRFFKKIK